MIFNWSSGVSKGDANVVYMSLCFFILFSADMTLTNMEKNIISSIQDENEQFKVDGYNLLSTLFIAFAITIWLAPSAVSVLGVRTTMSVAAILHTIYTFSFALEIDWLLYVTSVIGGTGTGLLWTASGKYLVQNSTPELVSRNIGIFWTFFSSSGLFGNLFAYFKLRGEKYINKESRHYIIYGLSAIAAVSAIAFALLRPIHKEKSQSQETEQGQEKSPVKELKKTWHVFKTKEMLILCITFCYTGLQQAFGFGIYSPSIGFTLQFGNKSKELIPISGIFVGIGQMSGGFWQMFQGQQLSRLKWGRRIVIFSGAVAHFISFALIFINLPAAAVFGNTEDKALIESNIYIALFCALLLGIGDGCLNTQNYSIIALLYPQESAQSCALYKFMKAVFVSLGYSMSSHLNLHQQVGGLSAVAVIGVIAFIYVDISVVKMLKANKKEDVETK